MRETWSDDRLDELNRKVDEGFSRVDADIRALRTETRTEIRELRSEMNERFDQVETRSEARFDQMNSRFDGMQRTLVILCGGIIAGLLGVIASIVATGGA